MKILLATSLPPETSPRALEAARSLIQAGHRLVVCCGGDRAYRQVARDEGMQTLSTGDAITSSLLGALLAAHNGVYRYDLETSDASIVFGAVDSCFLRVPHWLEPFDLLVVVSEVATARHAAAFRETALLGRTNGDRAFTRTFDEFILRELGARRFLRDFHWRPELELQDSAFGGFLFVPRTSLLMQLKHADYEKVTAAVHANETVSLAPSDDASTREMAAALYRTGALTR
jgi:hypothetical protein